ncbi:hypothetical protein Daus18300_014435 [Diaporthe australafricana]|uniref:Mid2 domain-containing protein n=1 Tax=Diaporthe australafricana TaxID=127596 RepID=A0ABR3VV65_9PEZI
MESCRNRGTQFWRDSDTQLYKTNGSLDLMWTDATFFSYESLSISCVSCYVKGTAYASLVVDGDFNFTQALTEFHDQFWPEVHNISIEVWDQFKNWSQYVAENITGTVGDNVVSFFQDGDVDDIDWRAYSFPTLDVDFGMNLTNIPETKLNLEFDDLELYLELDVLLEAEQTYKVNLYPPEWYQPAGIKIGNQLVGVVITLELLLTLSTEVDISTGVHVKFDDGLAIEVNMFGSDVSSITLTDGSFEFLPVTIGISGVVFDATLRLGVTAGLNMSQDLGHDLIKLAAGSSATVYTDLARFTTNITAPESLELGTRDDGCRIPVIESYEFGLGAMAGAFVQFGEEKWGPTPNTSVQIYYTTLSSACAIDPASATAAVEARQTAPALLAGRADLTAAQMTSVVTITDIVCQSAGMKNCPASLQTTVQVTTTSTAIVSVAEGEEPVFPATATTGKVAAVTAFGEAVQKLKGSSGSPVSYVPPVATDGSDNGDGVSGIIDGAKDEYKGMSEEAKRLTIGLSAGLGGAFLVAVAAGIWLCCKRRARKQHAMPRSNVEEVPGVGASQPFLGAEPEARWKQAQPRVSSISTADPTASQREERGTYDDVAQPRHSRTAV